MPRKIRIDVRNFHRCAGGYRAHKSFPRLIHALLDESKHVGGWIQRESGLQIAPALVPFGDSAVSLQLVYGGQCLISVSQVKAVPVVTPANNGRLFVRGRGEVFDGT